MEQLNLTARELEVLKLTGQGLTAREAGERLGIGARTVTTHITSIQRKAGIKRKALLVLLAIKLELI